GILRASSKSSTVALSDDDALIAMVNPNNNSLSTFSASTKTLLSRFTTGGEPSAVVFTPSRKSAWVANRADATVKLINGLDTASPSVGATVNVGSEPTGIALSPTGRFLVVAEWAEARVSVVDTTTNTVVSSLPVRNPRAVAITNDGDADDSDEKVVVTEFYGRTNTAAEATDLSRTGAVQVYTLSATGTLASDGQITFAPNPDGGFGAGYSPNQLFGVAIQNNRVYVPNIAASPGGAPAFDKNIAPVVLVADLATKTEVTNGGGSQSLAPLVNAFTGTKFFLADLVDLSFLSTTNVAYAVARGGEVMQRMVYDSTANTLTLGSTQNTQIDLLAGTAGAACQNPTGVVVTTGRAYVNCWGNQRLGIVDLATQTLTDAVVSVPAPTAGAEIAVNRGRHFYFTGRTRWSNSAWSSCGSCHPDGLSDNITWNFAAGPRQSTSMDGSYSHGTTVKQRIFNWTGIVDELHDFEGNTRGVQGGKGAITTATTAGDCGNLALETAVALPANNLASSAKEVADQGGVVRCVPGAWDDIDAFTRTIRPPKGRKALDAAAVTRGAAVFVEGNCANCHGGPGWTLSRRSYTPSTAVNAALLTTAFTKPPNWPGTWTFHTASFQVAAQPVAAEVTPFNTAAIPPPQVACVVRNIGTFGIPGDVTTTNLLEVKLPAATRAQGRGGYNIPSLYGMQVAAPLLHHGQAASLTDLFTDAKWIGHTQAANANFLTDAPTVAAMKRADLVQYLWSIDATTAEVAPATGFDGCP
ncbi:MAG: hypothetical protein H6Q89_2660, partial [Myxococcaceae bacterium]|nr:hypothetical protein [Myxococcaceae bacterium]